MNLKQISVLLLETQVKVGEAIKQVDELRGVTSVPTPVLAGVPRVKRSYSKRAYGRGSRNVVSTTVIEPVREKARKMIGDAGSYQKVSRASGIPYGALWRLVNDKDGLSKSPMKVLKQETADRINRLYEAKYGATPSMV